MNQATSTAVFENIPAELRAVSHWVVWRYEKGKKPPYDPKTGNRASTSDASTWATFPEAVATYQQGPFNGIGFVFAKSDAYTGVDLDDVRNPETNEVQSEALALVRRVDSYTEVSPSGKGLHIIVRASLDGSGRRKGSLEIYSQGRFFCMTGQRLPDTSHTIEDRQAVVNAICVEVFGDKTPKEAPAETAPVVSSRTDEQVLQAARKAKNGDKFDYLWRGEWEGRYPSHSEADAALLEMLRFHSGGDKAQCFRLFERSGLRREKWTSRPDYRERTWSSLQACPVRTPKGWTPRKDTALPPALASRIRGKRRRAVMLVFWNHQGPTGETRPSPKTIAKTVGISIKQAKRYRANLHREGFLTLVRKGGRFKGKDLVNVYRIERDTRENCPPN